MALLLLRLSWARLGQQLSGLLHLASEASQGRYHNQIEEDRLCWRPVQLGHGCLATDPYL